MNKDQLIAENLNLMELSSMEDDEKGMWRVLLPSMDIEELTKLKAALEKEVNKMTDIYLKAKKSSKK